MIIELGKPKTITIRPALPAVTEKISQVEIIAISDNCIDKVTAVVKLAGRNKPIVLWEGKEYDKIGNWTQKQANERIEELL